MRKIGFAAAVVGGLAVIGVCGYIGGPPPGSLSFGGQVVSYFEGAAIFAVLVTLWCLYEWLRDRVRALYRRFRA